MATLTDIRTKVRRLTGRPSPQQISDSQIDFYVNTFYQFDMPEHLKLFNERTTFSFLTVPNVDVYPLTNIPVQMGSEVWSALDVYFNYQPPAYVAGYQSFWTQDREQFFRIYPPLALIQQNLFGDGTPGPYAFQLQQTPVLQNSVTIGAVDVTGATQQAVDLPLTATTGEFVVPNLNTTFTGAINYVTGAGTITFTQDIPSTSIITITSTPYVASRPAALLIYDNSITLRPVPDTVYKVTVNAYQTPVALLASDNPVLKQWWQYLAYGAAKKIYEDSMDPESLAVIMPGFKEQEGLVLYRTIVQQANERTATIYTEQTDYPYGNFYGNRF